MTRTLWVLTFVNGGVTRIARAMAMRHGTPDEPANSHIGGVSVWRRDATTTLKLVFAGETPNLSLVHDD